MLIGRLTNNQVMKRLSRNLLRVFTLEPLCCSIILPRRTERSWMNYLPDMRKRAIGSAGWRISPVIELAASRRDVYNEVEWVVIMKLVKRRMLWKKIKDRMV